MAKKKSDKKKKSSKRDEAAPVEGTLDDVSFAVIQVARSFRTLISRELSSLGLYAGQEGVILSLAENDGLTAGAIAQRLGVKPPTMTRTIVRMETQGFLERRDGEDGRLTTVWLTPAGRETVERINEVTKGVQVLALGEISDKQQRNLLKYLKAVEANIQADLKSCDP